MSVSPFFRFLLIAALIGFTSRADAACLKIGAIPAAQQASDCADMGGAPDDQPTPERGHQPDLSCSFACLAIAGVAGSEVAAPLPPLTRVSPTRLLAMDGSRGRPPVPPPRAGGHRAISDQFWRMT